MKRIKKYGYSLIIAIFIITAITYVLEFIYIAVLNCFDIKLLPEPIWQFLDNYFYYEALPFRVMIAITSLVVLTTVLFIFYRKEISNATAILSATTPIVSAIG